jgi:hypothetical protein
MQANDVKIIGLQLQKLKVHLIEAVQQQVEICGFCETKSSFVELQTEASKLPLGSFHEEGFDTLPGHHGPPTGCKSKFEFC